jgi:hypothetical protein
MPQKTVIYKFLVILKTKIAYLTPNIVNYRTYLIDFSIKMKSNKNKMMTVTKNLQTVVCYKYSMSNIVQGYDL